MNNNNGLLYLIILIKRGHWNIYLIHDLENFVYTIVKILIIQIFGECILNNYLNLYSIQVVNKIIQRNISRWSINKITAQINKNKMNNKYMR